MSRKIASQAIQSRKQLQDSSTRTHTSTNLPSQSYTNHLDPLDDISLDIDLDQYSASSATLLSRRVSSLSTSQLLTDASDASSEFVRLPESRQTRFLYPLYEPGQRTAERTQRLRARTAAVIMSIPATREDVIDVDAHEPSTSTKVPPVAQRPKLRRVPGIRDLRRAFRDGDSASEQSDSMPSLAVSKTSYELGILVAPTSPLSSMSPRSSLCTLVDAGNAVLHTSGDVKTLCASTRSSITISSRFAARLYSTFSSSRMPHVFLSSDTPHSIKYPVRHLSITQTRRHTSLHLDTRLSRSPGKSVWSCAKISQSAAKRAARHGHSPRRVFSSPIASLPP